MKDLKINMYLIQMSLKRNLNDLKMIERRKKKKNDKLSLLN